MLADPPVWNADSIAATLAQGATRQVPLPQPVPVYLLYWTAFVDASGQVNFRNDLYGRDAPLEALLAGQAPAPLSAPPEVGCPVG